MRAEDSTGKRRAGTDARSRSAAASLAFILGLCLGVVISERLYVIRQEARAPPGALLSRRFGAGSTATLEALLRRVAPQKEVMIVISNMNLMDEGSLRLWLDCAARIPSQNWLVVAIDERLRDYCQANGINYYYRPVIIPDSQKGTGDNHAISAMKYEILEEFITAGWSVLLSDVDVVIVQDPMVHLYRDSDVEGMSDGFDPGTAYGAIYGIDDPDMGWSRYAQGIRHMVLNSGLFYLRANERTAELLKRIAGRLRKEKAWDQSVYNEEIFLLSHGDEYKSPGVSVRVMDIYKFMNSKTLFKTVRKLPAAAPARKAAVMVHTNYHANKLDRMKAIKSYYLDGDKTALDAFPLAS
jgi:hypothetical protein